MKLMKKLTDKRKSTLRIILQSLPIALAAIVFVIYAATFIPFSTDRMERSVALIECESYYQICANGKPVIWFKCLGDNCLPEGMSTKADNDVTTKTYSTGCWVNKYPLVAACPGLLVTANGDSIAEKNIAVANRSMDNIIKKTAEKLSMTIKKLKRKIEETDYYMRVHNVSDDGYNIMAAYAEEIKKQETEAEEVEKRLNAMAKSKKAEIRLVTKYTLLYRYDDTTDSIVRTPCNILTLTKTAPLRLLQTADEELPDGFSAINMHKWFTPSPSEGDSIYAAALPGCTQYKYNPENAKPKVFKGCMLNKHRHNLPRLLTPDGSAVFSRNGQFAGISVNGRIIRPTYAGFGLKRLMK